MGAEGHKSRRAALCLFAGAPALAILPRVALAARGAGEPVDPVFALIADHRAAVHALNHDPDESSAATEAAGNICVEKMEALCSTEPTTLAGASALLTYLIEDEADHLEAVAPFVMGVNSCIAALKKISVDA
jgi:hypothetical protein